MLYFEYYILGIILLPGILLAIVAQSKVSSTFNKYKSVTAISGVKTNELLNRLISTCGMDLKVKLTHGTLTDYFDPQRNEIRLSEDVYNSSSLSALGVACHEFGHALQKKENYLPYKIRKVLIPITNFASNLLWPLVIIGLIFNFGVASGSLFGTICLYSGVIIFGLSILVNLATLPVEYNASSRALKILESTNTLTDEELSHTKEVLNAAALTYVAAFVVSILSFLRFFLVFFRASRRD